MAMMPQTCSGPSCDQTGRTCPKGTPSQTRSGGSIVKATKTTPKIRATAASTSGYSGEIGLRQYRHLPLSMSQPKTGMLSYQASLWSHFGQRDDPVTTPSPSGRR